MKFICDSYTLDQTISVLGLQCLSVVSIQLRGIKCVHEPNGCFYFAEDDESTPKPFLLLEISNEDIWELDKLQTNLRFRKQQVFIKDQLLIPAPSSDCYIYQLRTNPAILTQQHQLLELTHYCKQQLDMNRCDIYLLIPGKISKEENTWESIPDQTRDTFLVFQNKISQCIRDEYASSFSQTLKRKCIGDITIIVNDILDGNTYYQQAVAGIVTHQTGICVLEIMIQNCSIGGNKVLNYYCGNQMQFQFQSGIYSLPELLDVLHIRAYGKKRSMVFSYGEVTEREIVNALANEEFPMGNIEGDFIRKVRTENIAQYDTAEVYASQETMFEMCSHINIFGNQRLAYHAIEIFFVELLLFQDAAIDKVYTDLEIESNVQSSHSNSDDVIERYEELSFDMSRALQFTDYDLFNYPTVRQSAKNVAKCFGIDQIYDKYERNKALLSSMIQANERRKQEKQDKVKNYFLFLLSATAAIGTVGDIFYIFYQDPKGGISAYVASLVIVTAVFLIYRCVLSILQRANKSKKRE